MTDAERAHARRVNDALKAELPEAIPFIRALMAEGMLEGLRNVSMPRPIAEAEAARAKEPGLVCSTKMVRWKGKFHDLPG